MKESRRVRMVGEADHAVTLTLGLVVGFVIGIVIGLLLGQ